MASSAVHAAPPAEGPALITGYGGRVSASAGTAILDLGSRPRVLRFPRDVAAGGELFLTGADVLLDPYGLAVPGDGTIWTLGDKGRALLRFGQEDGRLVEKRRLPSPCQTIAGAGTRVFFALIRIGGREPLLGRADNGGFRPFSDLVSRGAPDRLSAAVRNLFRCGSGVGDETPCWFMAGPPEVFLIGPDGRVRRVAAPDFVEEAPAADSADPAARYSYPIRDVFLLQDSFWVLSNQEGAKIPGQEGAVRGRHAVLVRAGRSRRVVSLEREARAILLAGERTLTLLYANGAIESLKVE